MYIYLSHLVWDNTIDFIALQETHIKNDAQESRCRIAGYNLVASINYPKHGFATHIKQGIEDYVIRSNFGTFTRSIKNQQDNDS